MTSSNSLSPRDKVVKSRMELLLVEPFFSVLTMEMKLIEDLTCETMWTNGESIGYSPTFIKNISSQELTGVLVHEIYHVMLNHMTRRKLRDPERWNIACDYAINPHVKKNGFILPAGHLYNEDYVGKSAEEIYNLLPASKSNKSSSGIPGEVRDAPKGKGMSSSQVEQIWKGKMAKAMKIAKMRGSLPVELEREIGELVNGIVSWKDVLSRFIIENIRNDYNWKRPNSRYLHMGLYLPKLSSKTLGTIAVIIDTSGSITQSDLNEYMSELKSILSIFNGIEIQVIYVDSKVQDTQVVSNMDFELRIKGGGGTSFIPGYDWMEENDIDPLVTIYFTDGECNEFPDEPSFETLWMISEENGFEPPFGEVAYYKKGK